MAETLRIYARLVGASMRGELQYRTSFVLRTVGHGMATFLDFIELAVLFLYLRALGGWSIEEVAFLYGLTSISFGLTDLIIGHLDLLPEMIRKGGFDKLLTRPLGSLFQILAHELSLRRVGKIAQAAAVMVWAISRLDISWDLPTVGFTLLTLVTSSLIFGGLWIAGITVAFWFVDAAETINTVTYGGNYLTQHPLTIFGSWIRRLVIFLVPVAFVAYFPALEILDKADALAYPRWTAYLGVPVAALCVLVARAQWANAVRRYRSTGS